jgi:hypothetical protein
MNSSSRISKSPWSSGTWPADVNPQRKPVSELERQEVVEHLLNVLGNKNVTINELVDRNIVDDFDLYGESRSHYFSASTSGVFSYFQKDTSDFLDNAPLGKSSSKDIAQLLSHIKTAAKKIFIGEGNYRAEKLKLDTASLANSRYLAPFMLDPLIHPLNIAQKLIQTRTTYFHSSFSARMFLVITACMAATGKALHRPILMKSSIALMTVTSLFMIALYYRFSMKEESEVFNLRWDLERAVRLR